MQVHIVPHGSPEYDLAVQLRREVLRWPLGLDFSAEDLARESDHVFFAILESGRAVACLQLVVNRTEARMRQVAVSPDMQGKGLGRVLVEGSEAWCRENGISEMVLNARETAIPFYVSLGYEITSELFEEVGIPHRAMRKSLD